MEIDSGPCRIWNGCCLSIESAEHKAIEHSNPPSAKRMIERLAKRKRRGLHARENVVIESMRRKRRSLKG